MDNSSVSPALVLSFGVFELDRQAGELRKSGALVHLPPQPFRILALLVSHSGQTVTREEIRQEIWGDDTYVDFEQCLNQHVRQIRTVLGDDAEAPRYIETLPRRGYRFIYPVTAASLASSSGETAIPEKAEIAGAAPVHRGEGRAFTYKFIRVAAFMVVAMVAGAVGFNVAGLRNRLLGPATRRPTIHSIAVLPLDDLSNDPNQEYFADGMTEELITTLGQIGALRVISRTSVLRYKGTQKPLPEIARELNVDAIVEGTVLRSGNRVRVTANLLDASTDRHLWARSYERNLGDVLALQDDVARDIASQIRIKLTPQEHAQLASARPVNPEAYRLYLQGRYFFFKRTLPAFDKSIQLFQQALERDPDSALVYAGLSESYGILPFYDGRAQPKDVFPKARAAALKALKIDSNLAEGHAALGYVLLYYDWDWPAAERELKRALELKPNYVVAHHWYAEYLSAMGRHEQAFAEITRAQELDPASPLMRAIGGEVYNYARRYDEAIEQSRKALDLDSNFGLAHENLGWGYLGKAMYKEAMSEFEVADRLEGRGYALDLARVYAAQRRREPAKIFDRLKEKSKRREIYPWPLLARLYAALGEKQKAIDLLGKAYEERFPRMTFLKVDPRWDTLRSDPRFQALLRRMNFPKESAAAAD